MGNHQNIQRDEEQQQASQQAIVSLLQYHFIRSQAPRLSTSHLQCLSISAPVSSSGDQQKWHKRPLQKKKRKKKTIHNFCALKGLGLWTNKKIKGDHVQQDKQHTRTFPRVRQSQWLHKDICCIHLQYLKKALLSLRRIYTLIGFFLASK